MQENRPRGRRRGGFGSALIVAQPGMLREALSGLISAMPEFQMVAVTANLNSALESVTASCPSVVLVEIGEVDAECLAQVQALKAVCPESSIIALARDPKETKAWEESAVDATLTEGVRPSKLTETILGFLETPGGTVAPT